MSNRNNAEFVMMSDLGTYPQYKCPSHYKGIGHWVREAERYGLAVLDEGIAGKKCDVAPCAAPLTYTVRAAWLALQARGSAAAIRSSRP